MISGALFLTVVVMVALLLWRVLDTDEMHFHSQNSNEGGSMFWHGRCWWRMNHREAINLCWAHGREAKFMAVSLDVDRDEREITLMLALYGVFAHWLTFRTRLIPSAKKYENSRREIRLAFHNETFWFSFWHDDSGWCREAQRMWTFAPLDFLFGQTRHNKQVLHDPQNVVISMPEGPYQGLVEVTRSTWARRWGWFKKERVSYDVEVPDGIPFPGKGTASYNLGEDALYSTGYYDVSSVDEAIERFRADVMDYRERYPL